MSLEGFATSTPVTFHARGLMRLLPAAFLTFWLCGWFVGEAIALAAIWGAFHALWDVPVPSWLPAVRVGANAAIPMLLFLGFWLALWTFGGFSAMAALAGLLWGREEISHGPDGIAVVQAAFPFRFVKRIPWDELWGIESSARALILRHAKGRQALGANATEHELAALAGELRSALHAARPNATERRWAPASAIATRAGELPRGWNAEMDEIGQMALFEPRGPRIFGGVALLLFSALMVLPIGKLISTALLEGWSAGPAAGTALLVGLMALLAWGGVTVAFTRQSIHPRPGTIVHRVSRMGRTREITWSPARLSLECRTDSDGDDWWELSVSGGAEKPAALISTMRQPAPALMLGRWLSERAGVPFEDGEPGSSRRSA